VVNGFEVGLNGFVCNGSGVGVEVDCVVDPVCEDGLFHLSGEFVFLCLVI
jgi:hypothetical protein